MQTLWLDYYQNRSHRVCVIGLTEITLCPNPNEIGPTEFGKLCVTVRFCVEAIYTPPPTLHLWREPSEHAYTSNIHFVRENQLLMC